MSENKIPTAMTSLAAYEARLKYESNCSTNDAFEDGFVQGAHWMEQRIDRAVEEAVRKERLKSYGDGWNDCWRKLHGFNKPSDNIPEEELLP